MSNSLRPHELQHPRLPCPLLSPEAQTHVHWVRDVIQTPHPLSPPSPLAFSLSQCQGLFQWVSSSCKMAKILELQLQHQPSQWIFRVDFLFPLELTDLISLVSKGLSRVFSSTTIQKHQFFVTQPIFMVQFSHTYDYWKNHSFDYMDLCQQSDIFSF